MMHFRTDFAMIIHMAQDISPIFTYLRFVLDELQISATELASRAGISASTITRFLNDPGYKFTPSTRTLQKIAKASGISFAPFMGAKDIVEAGLTPYTSAKLYDDTWSVADTDLGSTLVLGAAEPGVWKEPQIQRVEHSPPLLIVATGGESKPTDYFAVLMRGTSMDRVAQDGEYLLCMKRTASTWPLRSGEVVVIERQVKDLPLLEISARVLVKSDGKWHLKFATTDRRFEGSSLDIDDPAAPTGLKILGILQYVIRKPPDRDELIGFAR